MARLYRGDAGSAARRIDHRRACPGATDGTMMSPELALTELRGGLITVLWVAGPLLLTVLVVGVVVGVVQAATQLNEPTIAFVAKAAALTAVLFALGSLLIGHLVEFTTLLFQRIPHLIG